MKRIALCLLLLVTASWTTVFAQTSASTADRARFMRGRLRAEPRALTYADGTRFRWRFATGFRLVELVAHGRENEAVAFLKWTRATGFNGVRVLTMARHMFSLPPGEGLAALPRLLELAAREDLYVEVVALADTRAYEMSWDAVRAHVRAVGTVAAAHANTVVEVANEPYHGTQVDRLVEPAALTELAGLVPAVIPVAPGAPPDEPAKYKNGARYLTIHLERGRDEWEMVRRQWQLAALSEETGLFVVNDEPIGADELDKPGSRESNPAIWFTFGALSRITETATTFHFEDGLHARLPRPNQQRCADAFIAGAILIPEEVILTPKNARWADSPVRAARFKDDSPEGTVVRVYSGTSDTRGWTIAVGLDKGKDPGIEWQHGWSPRRVVAERAGVRVYEIANSAR